MRITKRMEIVTSIQFCLISRMNFDYMESGGEKAFLANPKHQYRVSQYRQHNYYTNKKKKRDCYEHTKASILCIPIKRA